VLSCATVHGPPLPPPPPRHLRPSVWGSSFAVAECGAAQSCRTAAITRDLCMPTTRTAAATA
jgi:hypothetical protein